MIIYEVWHRSEYDSPELLGLYSTLVKAQRFLRKHIDELFDFPDNEERLKLVNHKKESYNYKFDYDSRFKMTEDYSIIGTELDKE